MAKLSISAYPLKAFSKNDSSNTLVLLAHEELLSHKKLSKSLPGDLGLRLEKVLDRRAEKLTPSEVFELVGIEKNDPDIVLAIIPKSTVVFDILSFARKVLTAAVKPSTTSLGLAFLDAESEATYVDTFGSAVAVRTFLMPVYGKRKEKQKAFKLNEIRLYVSRVKNQVEVFKRSYELGVGANFVRSLGALPPNLLNTETYGSEIRKIAREYGFTLKYYSRPELKRMGANAFVAVDRGHSRKGSGIYELTYAPRSAKNKNFIALVGKGLCFDTGGYDVKTQGYMVTMKGDMIGSALALSNLMTASRLKIPLKMKAFLAVSENHISSGAYHADEVVTALNGTSIEVVNTDAEGRMVLADTLALASRQKPELILDFATLTGMATLAIGTSYSAGFTNREELHSFIVESGKASGERVWTFPLDKDYGKALESQVADTLQCTKGRGPDHILAAYFLKEFVGKDIPWVHIDLSAADKEGGLAHVDSMFTGFGVRWSFEFLKRKFKV